MGVEGVFLLKVLAAACGLGHVVLYSELPSFWGALALLFALVAALARWCCAHRSIKTMLLYSGIFSVAAAVGVWQLQAVMANVLPHTLDKQRVPVQFVITHMGIQGVRYQQFEAVLLGGEPVESVVSGYRLAGKKVRLSWYDSAASSLPRLAVGQQWQAEVTLRRPRGLSNPGGFDYAAWLLAQGYSATGYLSTHATTQWVATQPLSLLMRLRQHLSAQLSGVGGEGPVMHSTRFFKALLMGSRDELSTDDWQVLQATGTVHLMAISGLHVGLVAAIGFGLGLFVHRLALWGISRYCYGKASVWGYRLLPALMAISLAAGYALLAGFAVPTRRALIAVVLLNIAWSLGVRFAPSHLLALALLLVAWSEPFAWLQAGFWLSFAAVALLLLKFNGYLYARSAAYDELSPSRQKFALWRQRMGLGMAMQGLLSLAMCLPLWLLGFPASGLSPLANMIAVPLVALVFVPGLLLWIPVSFTPLGAPLLQLLGGAFDGLWWGLTQLAHSPVGLLWPSLAFEGVWAVIGFALLLIACVFMVLPRSYALPIGALAILALLAFGGEHKPKHFKMTALDVGQGLAIVTSTPRAPALIFDTGAAFGERFNTGAHIIAPYLRRTAVKNIAIMVSHGDADHKGGLVPLLQQFEPVALWSGERFSGLPQHAEPCYAGQQWRWGDARYTVLWPQQRPRMLKRPLSQSAVLAQRSIAKDATGVKPVSSNNLSCVLLIEYAGWVFLLPGDIDKTVEKALLAQQILPKVDVLIAPHHGSKTSSSEAFLQAIKPRHIVVSAAFKSRYGHPHASVVARYNAVGAKVWNTADHGAVSFMVNTDGQMTVQAERLANPKIWH